MKAAAESAKALAASFTAEGYEVQTTRIAMNSFEEWAMEHDDPVPIITELVALLNELDVAFFNLGPATTAKGRSFLVPLLHLSSRLSASCVCSTDTVPRRVDESAIADAADVMVALGKETEGGFGNFRFCATFCTPPLVAFFPAAYAPSTAMESNQDFSSRGDLPASKKSKVGGGADKGLFFTLGLECGDVALSALTKAQQEQRQEQQQQEADSSRAVAPGGERLPLATVTRVVSEAFKEVVVPLEAAALKFAASAGLRYGGLDASLNPGLDPSYSVGAAFEAALGVGRAFGSGGTLAVASALTEALKSLPVNLVGYSGLMLPPLEDTTLALRQMGGSIDNSGGSSSSGAEAVPTQPPTYGITELLSYSSVCGVGLDTVPIPGDTSAQQISSLLLDTAALSTKWNKPLSCRLFPVPGLKAGDVTSFDSPFLVNTRVFEMP